MLDDGNHPQACFVAHSLGSTAVSWMLHDAAGKVGVVVGGVGVVRVVVVRVVVGVRVWVGEVVVVGVRVGVGVGVGILIGIGVGKEKNRMEKK